MKPSFTPRLIRLKDAPYYLGTNKNYFNRDIRPALNEIRIGSQGVAFDRLDLDAWVEQYTLAQKQSYVSSLVKEGNV